MKSIKLIRDFHIAPNGHDTAHYKRGDVVALKDELADECISSLIGVDVNASDKEVAKAVGDLDAELKRQAAEAAAVLAGAAIVVQAPSK